MKKLLLLLSICLATACSASAQRIYLADTAFSTDIGAGGAEASCKAAHLEYNGWQMNRAEDYWVADVFTVPADSTWVFDTVIVYGYQYGSNTNSSFLNCNLQIYDGTPGLGGSVIWGDTSTNVLVSTGWTGIYKVDTFSSDNGLENTYRPIMYLKLHLATPPVLTAGTYWLSWSAAGTLANPPVSPDKVLPGRVNPPGQMGRGKYGGVWQYLTDSGQTNGLDMIIKASAALSVPAVAGKPAVSMAQNVPNPFNTSTAISFYMPQADNIKLCVYNATGQCVATLADGTINAGTHTLTMDAETLPTGVYYYQLKTSNGTEAKQMLLIR